jgi:hypothetical protein
MLVTDLNGEQYEWKMKGKEVRIDKRPRSSLHKTAREILKDRFPTLVLLEEVPIKVGRRRTLYLDFYLPLRRTAIEVQGEQHFKFSSLYHSSASDFRKQVGNDNDKSEWCEINGIDLVIFAFNNQDDWGSLI